MKSTYQTAVVTAPGTVTLEDRPLPTPGDGEVRVRLEGCGVCGSNLPIWEGRPWFNYPLPPGKPGHEGWGVIDAVGANVSNVKVGDRVAALSHHAFAEVDICDASQVVRLPEALKDQPFPGEALGCALNVFRRSDIQPHHRVAIIGIGFLGALLTQLCARTGAQTYAIARRPFAQDIARKMGATEVIQMDDHYRIIAEMKALTGGAGCDRVIEATGLQWPLDLAGELTAERGRLIIAGYHQDGPRQVNMQLWNWRGIDVINAHEREPGVYIDGMAAAVEAVAEGRLDPSPLYTHTFPLDELPRALDAMRDRSDGFLKAFVTYDN
jgi:threonine dehydrogenase-like Zn-dependent dehydrogenase